MRDQGDLNLFSPGHSEPGGLSGPRVHRAPGRGRAEGQGTLPVTEQRGTEGPANVLLQGKPALGISQAGPSGVDPNPPAPPPAPLGGGEGNSPAAGKLSHTAVSAFSPPDRRRRINLGSYRHTAPPGPR